MWEEGNGKRKRAEEEEGVSGHSRIETPDKFIHPQAVH